MHHTFKGKVHSFFIFVLLLTGCSFFIAVPAASAQRMSNPKLDSLVNEKDSVALQQRLEKLAQSDKEADLNLLVLFYDRKNDPKKTEDALASVIRKFPRGDHAFYKAGNAIVSEKSPAKKEQLLRTLKIHFPKQDRDMYYYDVAYGYAGQKDPKINREKILRYVRLVKDSGFRDQAYLLVAGQLVDNGDPTGAAMLVKGPMDSLKTKINDAVIQTLTPGGPPRRNPKAAYYSFVTLYARILLKENKAADALSYAKEAYDSSNKKNPGINSVYLNALIVTGNLKEAFPLIDKIYRKGEATPEIKQQLKNAYVQAHGTDAGYDTYFASIQTELMDSAKAHIAQFRTDGQPAPTFTLKDTEGKIVSLDSLKGKIVILDFWATWCGPCKRSFPAMQQAVNKYKNDPDVVFLFIDTWEHIDDPLPPVKDYIKDNKYTFQVLMDLKDPDTKVNKVVTSFKVTGIPTKFILDKNGAIVYRLTGFSGGDDAAVQEISAMIESARVTRTVARTSRVTGLSIGDRRRLMAPQL